MFPKFMKCVPEVGITIAIGIVAALLLSLVPGLTSFTHFNASLFFVGLLPPIVFNSGLHLQRSFFFLNFIPIMTYSVIGTIISASVIGGGIMAMKSLDLLVDDMRGVTWGEACTFAALISVRIFE